MLQRSLISISLLLRYRDHTQTFLRHLHNPKPLLFKSVINENEQTVNHGDHHHDDPRRHEHVRDDPHDHVHDHHEHVNDVQERPTSLNA